MRKRLKPGPFSSSTSTGLGTRLAGELLSKTWYWSLCSKLILLWPEGWRDMQLEHAVKCVCVCVCGWVSWVVNSTWTWCTCSSYQCTWKASDEHGHIHLHLHHAMIVLAWNACYFHVHAVFEFESVTMVCSSKDVTGLKCIAEVWENCNIRPHQKRSLFRLTSLKILRAGGRSFCFLKIFYRCPATDSDVSDVDKRPCSIDKSEVSTSLTRRRCPRQSTLFSSNRVTDTAAMFSRLKGRHRKGSRGALYLSWSKTQFRIDTATQACTWTTWRCEKSLRLALQNAVGRVSRNRDLFRCGLIKDACSFASNSTVRFVLSHGFTYLLTFVLTD